MHKVALSVHFMKMSLEMDAESKIVQMIDLIKAKHAESTSKTGTSMCKGASMAALRTLFLIFLFSFILLTVYLPFSFNSV